MTMVWIMFGLMFFMLAAFIVGMIVASIMDWRYQKKYGPWIALQHDHTRPKRPLAK